MAKNDRQFHVRLFVSKEQLGSNWTDFHEIFMLDFSKICRENSSVIKT
jgi:hypothetical protein